MIKRLITTLRSGATTYRAGLLQDKVYRVLKNHTREQLKEFKITTVDWALLGLLNDNRAGVGLQHIARIIGVAAPFITKRVDWLAAQGLVAVAPNTGDRRTKSLVLTPIGLIFIPKVEKVLRHSVKELLVGIPRRHLVNYLDVLTRIVENAETVSAKKKNI